MLPVSSMGQLGGKENREGLNEAINKGKRREAESMVKRGEIPEAHRLDLNPGSVNLPGLSFPHIKWAH